MHSVLPVPVHGARSIRYDRDCRLARIWQARLIKVGEPRADHRSLVSCRQAAVRSVGRLAVRLPYQGVSGPWTSSTGGRNPAVFVVAASPDSVEADLMAMSSRGRVVVMVAFPGVQALDLVGPMEVFTGASQIVAGAYDVRVVAARRGQLETSSGIVLMAEHGLPDPRAGIDTLLVCGGPGVAAAERDQRLIGWLPEAAANARRVTSVCNGALLLACAGLLDGRRATTHWAACPELAGRYDQVTVEDDAIFVRDGRVWTSAGVTAGMDLALALVEEDLGRAVALEIARWLVLFVKRPGGQSQFSAHLAGQRTSSGRLREVAIWINRNLAADLRVETLADRACMSTRNFSRSFRREVGVTPAKYVETSRVQAARQALADTGDGVDAVAARCGFGTAETMRRAFHRHLGIGPADYRARFTSALGPATRNLTRG